jgi:uridine phosphorylase
MIPPILDAKRFADPSVFRPENLLRESRRQRGLPEARVPALCILDPDGDIESKVRAEGAAPVPGWACYHTEMLTFSLGGQPAGIVGRAVGAPFAVLLAEQMVASGCRLLLSLTSAGRIASDLPESACFMLIDRALRDEGTSHHYRPSEEPFAEADPALAARAWDALVGCGEPMLRGVTWTTDAPFRETQHAIDWAAAYGAQAVEMESAALYAFARARGAAVLCLAHITNAMAQTEGDFEKGEANGAEAALRVLAAAARALPAT